MWRTYWRVRDTSLQLMYVLLEDFGVVQVDNRAPDLNLVGLSGILLDRSRLPCSSRPGRS